MITNRTQLTVYNVLTEALDSAIINRDLAKKDGHVDDIDYWTHRAEDARAALSDFTAAFDNDVFRWYKQAEDIKQILECSMASHGAKITITVARDSGTTVTAELYDHAALVQGLWDALDYFQSEL